MPPKKKKGKKGKKKKKGEKGEVQELSEMAKVKQQLFEKDLEIKQFDAHQQWDRLEQKRLKITTHQSQYDLRFQKEKYREVKEIDKKRYKEMTEERNQLIREVNDLKDEFLKTKVAMKTNYYKMENEYKDENRKLENKYVEMENLYKKNMRFEIERASLLRQHRDMQQTLEDERRDKEKQISRMEREKIEEILVLRGTLKQKWKATKDSLMKLRKDQLDTTARLTILENHQLKKELEFQQKETERVVLQLKKLKEQLFQQKVSLKIHEEVEDSLAKRSHQAQSVVKRLNKKLENISEQQKNVKFEDIGEETALESQMDLDSSSGRRVKKRGNDSRDELVVFLEQQLTKSERTIAKLKNDIEILQLEYEQFRKSYRPRIDKSKPLGIMLYEKLQKIIKDKGYRSLTKALPSIHDNRRFDIEKLRKVAYQDWPEDDKEVLLNVLINQITPFMHISNLIPTIDLSKVDFLETLKQEQRLRKITTLPKIYSNNANKLPDDYSLKKSRRLKGRKTPDKELSGRKYQDGDRFVKKHQIKMHKYEIRTHKPSRKVYQ